MSGLGFSKPDRRPPAPSRGQYNQDEEVRRFQEEQRAKERERIRREQEAQQQRRRGYRPEDPQMGSDGRPMWPYDRPYVGPRVTGEVIRTLDNVPGVSRITGPAITVATAASGGPPPGEPPLPGGPRRPSGYRAPTLKPRPLPPPGTPPRQLSSIYAQNSKYHRDQSDFWSQQEEIAYRRGDTEGRAAAIKARNWHDQQYVRWQEEQKKAGMSPRGPSRERGATPASAAEADFESASRRRIELQKRIRELDQAAKQSKDPRAAHALRNALAEYEKANAEWKAAGERLRRSRQGG